MKKLLKKIVVFLCVSLIATCSFGCDFFTPADTRTDEEKAWDRLAQIPEGNYSRDEIIDGWQFSYTDRADEIQFRKWDGVYEIEVLAGEDDGLILTVTSYKEKFVLNSGGVVYKFNCEQSGIVNVLESVKTLVLYNGRFYCSRIE